MALIIRNDYKKYTAFDIILSTLKKLSSETNKAL